MSMKQCTCTPGQVCRHSASRVPLSFEAASESLGEPEELPEAIKMGVVFLGPPSMRNIREPSKVRHTRELPYHPALLLHLLKMLCPVAELV